MTDSKIIDASVWLAYLFEGHVQDIIEKEEMFLLSSLSLFEIKSKLLKRKIPNNEINNKIEFVKKRSNIISADEKIAEKAADITSERNLPALDSLIYATAIMHNSKLITLDNDFRGLENVDILQVK